MIPVRQKVPRGVAEEAARLYPFSQPWLGIPTHLSGMPGIEEMAHAQAPAPRPGAEYTHPPAPAEMREGLRLFPWQARSVPWIVGREAVHLAPWATGSGKTLTAWWVARTRGRPALWLTAARLRLDVIGKIRGYSPGLTEADIYLCAGAKGAAIPDGAKLVVASWEGLQGWGAALVEWAKKADPDLVMDEIHMMSDHSRYTRGVGDDGRVAYTPKLNRAYWAQQVSLACNRRIGMTATPVADRPKDLWAQLDLVEPGCWGTYREFTEAYCEGHNEEVIPGRFAWVANGSDPGPDYHARRRLTTSTVEKSEVAKHLPPMTIEIIYLPKSEQNRFVGEKEWRRKAAMAGMSNLEAGLLVAAGMKRKWLTAQITEDYLSGLKIAAMTGRREDRAALYEALRAEEISEVMTGDGGDSDAHRYRIARSFLNAPAPAVLVGTTDSFGTGYDLQDADVVYVAQIPWNYKLAAQLIGRFNRPGQKRSCCVKFIVAEGTIDEHVSQILLSKMAAVVATAPDSEATMLEAVLGRHQDEDAILAEIMKRLT